MIVRLVNSGRSVAVVLAANLLKVLAKVSMHSLAVMLVMEALV